MSIEYYQEPVKVNIENFQEDVINKLQIHKTRDNAPSTEALNILRVEYKDDFECVSTLTDEMIKPTCETTDEHIIAIARIPRCCDIFRFNKIQLMDDNVVIDNVVVDKIQLVISDKVIIDDLNNNNIYYPLITGQYTVLDIRVFIDKTSITRENLNMIDLHFNVMLTYERVNVNTAVRAGLVTQNYELLDGVRYENGHVIHASDELHSVSQAS
jgi:hypothetical protein